MGSRVELQVEGERELVQCGVCSCLLARRQVSPWVGCGCCGCLQFVGDRLPVHGGLIVV